MQLGRVQAQAKSQPAAVADPAHTLGVAGAHVAGEQGGEQPFTDVGQKDCVGVAPFQTGQHGGQLVAGEGHPERRLALAGRGLYDPHRVTPSARITDLQLKVVVLWGRESMRPWGPGNAGHRLVWRASRRSWGDATDAGH